MSETPTQSRTSISTMRLPELKEMAASMGISMPPKSLKADYVSAIRSGGRTVAASQNEAPQRATSDEAADAGAQPRVRRQPSDASDRGDRRERRRPREDREERQPRDNRENREEREERQPRENRERREDAGDRRRESDINPDKQAALDALGDAAVRRAEDHRGEDGEDRRDRNRNRRDRNRNRRERNRDRQANGQNGQQGQGGNQNQNQNQGQQNQRQEREDEVLVPVAGILDIEGNNAYLRTGGYLPGKNDAYVSQQLIKKFGLRRGDAVQGAVRQVVGNEEAGQQQQNSGGRNQRNQRQHKFNPLQEVIAINGLTPEDSLARPEFNKLTPLYPQDMLRLETSQKALTTRIIDLVAPIGKGQRGLIVSPPKAGKTIIMQQIAMAISKNDPNVHLMVVLVDERPEEVTDMQRLVKGEVIASTFDRPASDHTIVAELAVERAKRLVELGQDVVILLDSLTRLSRAYNLAAPASGRILSGGVDAAALYPPKKFFGAARNIENGGSLTIIASALVETGSKMDEVIFEEFKGTGNMELRLSRQLADRRIFPAVDINASGTRREELLFSPEELKIVHHLRRALGTLDFQEASDYMLGRLRKTESNGEFLMSVVRGMQNAGE